MTATFPKLDGVSVAVCTPFKENGDIDLDAFTQHLEFLGHHKVSGFVACGTTGEGATLTTEERRKILQRTQEVAKHFGIFSMAGCGSPSTAVALELVDEAKGFGFDAALIVTPYYNKPSQNGLFQHYQTLATQSAFPIVLYNVPSRTSVNLQPEVALRLMEHPWIAGIKEASGQYCQWLALSQSSCWEKKYLLSGDDDAFAPFLALGGRGLISACANFAPQPFVALYEAAKASRWEEAFRIQKQLYSLVRALFIETNPAPVKYALSRSESVRGYPPFLRLPLVPVSAASEKVIDDAVKERRMGL